MCWSTATDVVMMSLKTGRGSLPLFRLRKDGAKLKC